MASIHCFLLEPTDHAAIKLRRYCPSSKGNPCTLKNYHDASTRIEDELIERDKKGYISNGLKPVASHEDSRWPQQCPCGYAFQEDDEWQRFTEQIYQRADTGERVTLGNVSAGAMWYAEWLDDFYLSQEKHVLVVKTPGGEWTIDGQAKNCTMPDDTRQEKHHCWIRHGIPPNITVDKNGVTCGAGAGSIQCGSYHGFLRNGYLED